ncbi:hypothetical protein DL98DRAFT_574311 [Cadophora sp. DSE1049]|nr:hypothetical protein DL98DRAFT_574311 [Cadophora sp. DSE1049]
MTRRAESYPENWNKRNSDHPMSGAKLVIDAEVLKSFYVLCGHTSLNHPVGPYDRDERTRRESHFNAPTVFISQAECFRVTNRKRTFTTIFAASAQQIIGATFVIGYATYFLELIGIKDYFSAFVALYVVMLVTSTAAFSLTEIYGRRFLIVIPQFILCLVLLLIGIMGCVPNKSQASWGIVAFIYTWAPIYQLSIGATGFVLASDIATMRLRGATQGLITITNACWGLIMQFTVPYMINPDAGDLGGKVVFIFLGTGIIAAVGRCYLYPETKGISFEKLDRLYAMKIPAHYFENAAMEMDMEHPMEHTTEVAGLDNLEHNPVADWLASTD